MKQLAIAAILLLMTVFCAAACSGSEVPAVSAASEVSDTSEASSGSEVTVASEVSGETGPENVTTGAGVKITKKRATIKSLGSNPF